MSIDPTETLAPKPPILDEAGDVIMLDRERAWQSFELPKHGVLAAE